MATLDYDEPALVAKLTSLPTRFRSAFAVLCARRLIAACAGADSPEIRDRLSTLLAIVDRLWYGIASGALGTSEAEASLAACMGMLPESDEDKPTEPDSCEEDAISALAYALRAWISGDPQEAAWAARRAYEAIDRHVMQRDSSEEFGTALAERRVLFDPLVQAELMRQTEDIRDLTYLAARPNHSEELGGLLVRAAITGKTLFSG